LAFGVAAGENENNLQLMLGLLFSSSPVWAPLIKPVKRFVSFFFHFCFIFCNFFFGLLLIASEICDSGGNTTTTTTISCHCVSLLMKSLSFPKDP